MYILVTRESIILKVASALSPPFHQINEEGKLSVLWYNA